MSDQYIRLLANVREKEEGSTLESRVSISDAMFSNTCSSSKRGTSSTLVCLAPVLMPNLLNATSFASISFSKCLACFLRSATAARVTQLLSLYVKWKVERKHAPLPTLRHANDATYGSTSGIDKIILLSRTCRTCPASSGHLWQCKQKSWGLFFLKCLTVPASFAASSAGLTFPVNRAQWASHLSRIANARVFVVDI